MVKPGRGETIIQFIFVVFLHVLQASKHTFLVSSQEMCVTHGGKEKYDILETARQVRCCMKKKNSASCKTG